MALTADVVVIGAGAAGLMCALTAGYRGRRVLVLDHANKAGKKILMSGGGKCNFTHLESTPANFLSANPHFCISALKRYTPQHFLELVERHGIDYYHKTPGQLFCKESSKEILQLLLTECEWAGVDIRLNTSIEDVDLKTDRVNLTTSIGPVEAEKLVVASGGLSIPTLGASGFAYQVAGQFGLDILPTRAGLVPFTMPPEWLQRFKPLSGLSCEISVTCNKTTFSEPMLFTHRGLSGPAMLQISSYWQPGQEINVDLLPAADAGSALKDFKRHKPRSQIKTFLTQDLPKRLAATLVDSTEWQEPVQTYSDAQLGDFGNTLNNWRLTPAGTEGYRTAEVTLGGVDTKHLSSKTFAVKDIPNLHFIGEALDVTGHLGGHNFQWAWASGYCTGDIV